MSSLLQSKLVGGEEKDEFRTWAGVVGGGIHTQPLGHVDPDPNPLDGDTDHEFLNSLFDDILNDPLALEPVSNHEQVADGLEYIQQNELLTYLSSSCFRRVISDCPVFNRQVDSCGIQGLMEKAMAELTSQDIKKAKMTMKDTLQSYSKIEQMAECKRVKRKEDHYHVGKALLDASSPSVLDILHRPSTSTEHVPLDMNVEALFQSPLTDLCDLKLTLSPHVHDPNLGQLPCHPL